VHVAASSSVGDDAQGGFVVLLMFIRLKVRPLARARKETSPSRRAHTATTDARGTVTSLSSGPGPEPGEAPRSDNRVTFEDCFIASRSRSAAVRGAPTAPPTRPSSAARAAPCSRCAASPPVCARSGPSRRHRDLDIASMYRLVAGFVGDEQLPGLCGNG